MVGVYGWYHECEVAGGVFYFGGAVYEGDAV